MPEPSSPASLEGSSRREFLRQALRAGTAVALAPPLARSFGPTSASAEEPRPERGRKAAGEKLNLGIIGVAGRGGDNLREVAGENIAVLCDIDRQHLAAAQAAFPRARAYEDFRRLLDHKELDAVVVSTPDHTHAVAVVAALRAGLDVYCEKPLAHSVHEVRVMRETAPRHGSITQMGTQIHAGDNYRRAVEIVQAGVLGAVRRVHVWMGGRPNPGVRVKEATPPEHVNYDLWLGPAPYRPFHPSHFHFQWRYWWDFGGGMLADFGCHYIDLPHWALELTAPVSIEAAGKKDYDGDNDVPGVMRVDYEYPERGKLPPVHLTWYHGGWMPEGAEAYGKSSAVLFEGEKGKLLADYGTRKLFLGDGKDGEPVVEKRIPDSTGHHREWVQAVKERGPTTCNFDYSGALAEAVLLGNVAYRSGEKLRWDAKAAKVTNTAAAEPFLRREYRSGWTL